MTIREVIEAARCRKGKAHGTTRDGAYWLAAEPISIRRWGGDGIGQSGASCEAKLELRHYRSGECRAVVHIDAWHQNGARPDSYHRIDILDCTTAEDVIVALKRGISGDDGRETIYSDRYEDKLTAALTAMGLAAAPASPDEGGVS